MSALQYLPTSSVALGSSVHDVSAVLAAAATQFATESQIDVVTCHIAYSGADRSVMKCKHEALHTRCGRCRPYDMQSIEINKRDTYFTCPPIVYTVVTSNNYFFLGSPHLVHVNL